VVAGGSFATASGATAKSVALWNGLKWLPLGTSVSDELPLINALATTGNSLYVGGQFATIGDVPAQNVARWDGTNWLVMSTGVGGANAMVNALAAAAGRLYVGGQFDSAGNLNVRNIAQWNLGNQWSQVGGGLLGYANALAVNLHGELYVGGSFSQAGQLKAGNIAKWDGRNWWALSNGVDGPVQAVALSGSEVLVGGNFANAGAVGAKYIARWNGTNWFPLGSGLDGPAYALAVSGAEVYVGGAFSTAGGVTAQNVAKWNGSAWLPLGVRTDGPVYALAVTGSRVFAGGAFTNAGGGAALNIARWESGRWWPLAGGVGSPVYAINVAENGALFVGGESSEAGVIDGANNIARWNGTSWRVLGSGVNGTVRALLLRGAELYAGGSFTTAGGIGVMNFARWHEDVGAWVSFGQGTNNGVQGNVLALAEGGSNVYVGGIFTAPSGTNLVRNLGGFLPSRWEAMGRGVWGRNVGGSIAAVAATDNAVYVGGALDLAGGLSVSNIAKWDGDAWSALDGGVNGAVAAIAINADGEVFAGGEFTAAGGVTAWRIARWDGSRWSPLGLGLDGRVNALAVNASDLYAGGEFTRAGGFSANAVAKWDGSAWSRLGAGINGNVLAVAVAADGRVYAGGEFTLAGEVSANRIAVWDGTKWAPLGSGLDGAVGGLATSGMDLFVGGRFTLAGGSPDISYFARWDGTRWWALGGGLSGANPYVNALAVNASGMVFVGGEFTLAGGLPANRVAAWDGIRWSLLGTGLDGAVSALALRGREVFVGGDFTTAGKKPSLHFGHWSYVNVPPDVSLVKPGLGATFVAPAQIGLLAEASDSDGAVASVSFYSGTNRLSLVSGSPYQFVWSNVLSGTYSLTARAADDDGAMTVSSEVVVVVKTNQPPLVSITAPTNNAVFFAPLHLPLGVDVFDSDGTVTKVEYFAGTNLIATATNAPFAAAWSNVPPGNYLLSATATDERGGWRKSAPVSLTVSAPEPLRLSGATLALDGQFHFQFSGQAGGSVLIEASTNLTEWVVIATNSIAAGTNDLEDRQAPLFPWRFYRAAYLPW
jgi:hypothetical protein